MPDNKIFNVNGRTREQLALAIKLLLLTEYNRSTKVEGWYVDPKKGLVLMWHCDGKNGTAFTNKMGQPEPISEEDLVEVVHKWLGTNEALLIPHENWDYDAKHDGSNELGWRLYTEDWGHIGKSGGGTDHYSIAAIKPAYLWYGK
jgi:hypothetical protein